MYKIVTMYNTIGGVSKTTTLFNLAAYLSKKKSVLIADCDPRSSITALFFASDPDPNFNNPSIELPGTSIYKILEPRFKGETKKIDISSIKFATTKNFDNLSLLRGDINFWMAESHFANAWANVLSENYRDHERNTYVVLNRLLNDLSAEFDYVLCDIGACPSYTSRLVLLSSDCYYIPLIPDRLSLNALSYLAFVTVQWMRKQGKILRQMDDAYLHNKYKCSELLGGILHYLKPTISSVEKNWEMELEEKIRSINGLPMSNSFNKSDPFIAKFEYLGQLPAMAQFSGKPIFELEERDFINFEMAYVNNMKTSNVSYNDWTYWDQKRDKYKKDLEKLASALK